MTSHLPAHTGRFEMRSMLRRMESPTAPYYILLGATSMLTMLGLVMVLSASSVTSFQDSGSSFTVFKSQAIFAVIGIVGAVCAARIPVRIWKKLGWPLFLVALVLQMLVFVPGLGVSVNGNRNWIRVAGFTAQPSEIGKLALVLLAASVFTVKRRHLLEFKHVLIPVIPAALLLLGLVMAGHDLGTALVLTAILGGILFVAGIRMRIFAIAAAFAAIAVTVLVQTSANRMGRIGTWISGCSDSQADGCWQRVHGAYALADGGWWGVGLGASREKWGSLPEAHNDFIFAIIGEELGLPGTLIVVCLYGAIAYACYRLIATSKDFFVRLATAGVMVWIIAQATVNIGSVLGLLPVIGVPLPLVSAGGSQLVTSLIALGMLMSFARNEPDCKASLAGRPKLVGRTRAVLPTGRGGK